MNGGLNIAPEDGTHGTNRPHRGRHAVVGRLRNEGQMYCAA